MKITDRTTFGCAPGWKRYEGNPVLGREYGETYDVCVLQFGSVLRMYLSLRYSRSIGMTESRDGIHWGPVIPILLPEGEEDLNRPMVLQIDGMFYMWYTKMRCTEHPVKLSNVLAEICLAVSRDGIHFERQNRLGLTATEPWENEKVTCPFVREENGLFRMWYSGGGHWEPDHIGYAESHDGIHWEKSSLNPVFCPHPGHYWERGHTESLPGDLCAGMVLHVLSGHGGHVQGNRKCGAFAGRRDGLGAISRKPHPAHRPLRRMGL